jgi:hypothetical protein
MNPAKSKGTCFIVSVQAAALPVAAKHRTRVVVVVQAHHEETRQVILGGRLEGQVPGVGRKFLAPLPTSELAAWEWVRCVGSFTRTRCFGG